MRINRTFAFASALAIVLIMSAASLYADPPSRVGRLNLVNGEVSFKPESLDDWSVATVNYPVTTGDSLWTSNGAEAEIHVGSTAIRLGSDTDVSFLNLDDQTIQTQLPGGSVDIRLRHLASDETVEVDTPNASVVLVSEGSYRIDVKRNGNTRVTVRLGQADMTVADQDFTVAAGQAVMVPQANPQGFWSQAMMPADAWDTWYMRRDAQEDNVASTQYLPADLDGVEDLDPYGTWTTTPDYGPVWQPSHVAADWAPYSDGRWAWVEPWGWTWIDNAPWGFAPFHYGRWAHLSRGWGWVPGKAVQRLHPVYASALVVFVGGTVPDRSWRGNGIGWFPLGPREAYVPPYRAGGAYLRDLNAFAGADVGDGAAYRPQSRYVNRDVRGALRGAPGQSFGRGQSDRGTVFPAWVGEMARAPVMGTTARVVPERESVVGFSNSAGTTVQRPAAGLEQRRVVARTAPPPAQPRFAARQSALESSEGRPLDRDAVNKITDAAPVTRNVNVVNQHDVKKVRPPHKSDDLWWLQQSGS